MARHYLTCFVFGHVTALTCWVCICFALSCKVGPFSSKTLLSALFGPNMDTQDIQTLLQELTSTAYDMNSAQLTDLNTACHIIEQITSEQCRQLIARAGDRPCLQMFMSDGWSTDIRTRFKSQSRGVGVNVTGRLRT